MKRIIVTRKKKFQSAWVPFWIISERMREHYRASFQAVDDAQLDATGHPRPSIPMSLLNEIGVCIRNGETVTVELPDDVTAVYASTMDGILSNKALLTNGIPDGDAVTFRLSVTARGGFAMPSYPWFEAEEF